MKVDDNQSKPVKQNQVIEKILGNLSLIIKGKSQILRDILISILGGVNILLEDVPGTGKTTLAKGLARSIEGDFRRVQFTPDLLPADVLGSTVYNPREGSFYFKKGPIFTNILLADEINRASPRTQSSLLEAMNESQVTIDGVRHPLPEFFMVVATQNPVEFHGTYPLPEAQLDRFGISLTLGYPSVEDEIDVYYTQNERHPIEDLKPVADLSHMSDLQGRVKKVRVSKPVAYYIANIADASRKHPELKLGVSTRGSLMLYRMVQARAFMEGRKYTTPDDVKAMAVKVLAHRLVLDTKARYSGMTKAQIIEDILKTTPVPT